MLRPLPPTLPCKQNRNCSFHQPSRMGFLILIYTLYIESIFSTQQRSKDGLPLSLQSSCGTSSLSAGSPTSRGTAALGHSQDILLHIIDIFRYEKFKFSPFYSCQILGLNVAQCRRADCGRGFGGWISTATDSSLGTRFGRSQRGCTTNLTNGRTDGTATHFPP